MAENEVTIVKAFASERMRALTAALQKGLWKAGVIPNVLQYMPEGIKTKRVIAWNWANGEMLIARGHDVLLMEMGYVGDRKIYTSLGWNGLNGYATFPDYPDDGGARFAAHGGVIKPWKTGGNYALILGQVPGDTSLQGRDLRPWYAEMAEKIKAAHGLPVHFRPHPEALKARSRLDTVPVWDIPGCIKSEGSLNDALEGAAFTVCFNSNSSVDSVLAGVPCIVADKGSMAWEVCGHEIGEIVRPEREKWAHQLAFRQWSLDEIANGKALERLFT